MAVPYIFAPTQSGTSIPLAYLDANFAYLATSPVFTGNVTINGTLTVVGATSLSTLSTSGLASFASTSTTGNATFLDTITIGGVTSTGVTGTGNLVFSNTPTFVTPILGTPQSGILTNCTGLPLTTGVTGVLPSANGGTGVNNGSSTITIGGNVTVSGAYPLTMTLSGSTSVTMPTSGTLANNGDTLNFFSSTTSAQLASVISDETGTGSLVFADSPTMITPRIKGSSTGYTAIGSANAGASNYVFTLPAVTDTAAVLGTAQTFTATQTFSASGDNAVFGANGGNNGQTTYKGSTSGSVTVKSAAVAGTSTNFQLPASNGTNKYFLTTDGSGNTSWSNDGSALTGIATVGDEAVYTTVATATAATIDASVDAVKTLGYSTVGDPGAATYKRSASEPTHAGKFQSADGAWWELTTLQPNPYMFGAAGNGSTNDTTALQNLFDYADAKNTIAYLAAGNYAVPSLSLTVATNVQVVGCGRDAQIWRTTDVAVPVFDVSSKTAVLLRDFSIIKTVTLTSTTSNTIAGSGTLTFTVSTNSSTGQFPYSVGQYITIKAGTSLANYMVGTVSSYSGTTLVVAITGSSGSGTFSSWQFTTYTNSNAAVIFSGCTSCTCDNIYAQGTFYVGLETLNGTYDTIQNCTVSGIWNRGLYLYSYSGTSFACKLLGNTVLGASITDYAINCNGSTAGYILDAIISNNFLYAPLFDGIVVGGRSQRFVVSGNQIDNVVGSQGGTYVGIGILVEEANTYQASYNTVSGNNILQAYNAGICVLNAYATNVSANSAEICGIGIYCLQSGSTYTNVYHTFTGNNITGCSGAGIQVATGTAGYSYGIVFTGNSSCGNSTYGFLANSNSDRLSVTGNALYANTTANYSNAATNSVAAGNVTS